MRLGRFFVSMPVILLSRLETQFVSTMAASNTEPYRTSCQNSKHTFLKQELLAKSEHPHIDLIPFLATLPSLDLRERTLMKTSFSNTTASIFTTPCASIIPHMTFTELRTPLIQKPSNVTSWSSLRRQISAMACNIPTYMLGFWVFFMSTSSTLPPQHQIISWSGLISYGWDGFKPSPLGCGIPISWSKYPSPQWQTRTHLVSWIPKK